MLWNVLKCKNANIPNTQAFQSICSKCMHFSSNQMIPFRCIGRALISPNCCQQLSNGAITSWMAVVPVLSFIVSIIVAVVSIPPSFGPIVIWPPVPLTVNSVDGTDVDDSLDAATLKFGPIYITFGALNHRKTKLQKTRSVLWWVCFFYTSAWTQRCCCCCCNSYVFTLNKCSSSSRHALLSMHFQRFASVFWGVSYRNLSLLRLRYCFLHSIYSQLLWNSFHQR